jgi:co-chaperonin GroES (HSP10)
MQFTPLHDRVVVKRVESEEKTKSSPSARAPARTRAS